MYSCSADHTAKCWVIEFGECTRTYKGAKHTVGSMLVANGLCKYKYGINQFIDYYSIYIIYNGLIYVIL